MMERTCGICQSVTYDDEESICSVCGAELAPPDDTEVEEVQETSDSSEPAEPGIELDLGDLELDEPDAEETSEAPITPVRVDEPEIDELELDD
ncbi:MAG: hypothetical protein KAJ33_00160, partial [Thermoplasmata archaeon]|nr:hypothetical protein [Thermoplasmata archaeon]